MGENLITGGVPLVIHLCRKCGYISHTKEGRAWNFAWDPATEKYGDLCKSCRDFASNFSQMTVWVYIDAKLEAVKERPLPQHFSIQDEQVFRNLVSLGDQVYVSDGVRVWRWGMKLPLSWAVFNRIHNRWKQLYSKQIL
jgi:hypothetical protein